jgi:hypothetical protein
MNTYIVISHNRIIIWWYHQIITLSIYSLKIIQIFYLLSISFKTTRFYLIKKL